MALALLRGTRMHVVLLGDSIFDNAAYTRGEPGVAAHLRSLLPVDVTATLLAVDGARVADLSAQIRRLPADATNLVVSIGGNDALGNFDLLSMRVTSSAQALEIFAARIAAFETAYRAAIGGVAARGFPLTICTIYNGALEKDIAAIAKLGVALFNDVILRTAADLRIDVIELRAICNDASDYANPIEPSGSGGLKIAKAIMRAVGPGGNRAAHLIGG